jgi:hypothetical protein
MINISFFDLEHFTVIDRIKSKTWVGAGNWAKRNLTSLGLFSSSCVCIAGLNNRHLAIYLGLSLTLTIYRLGWSPPLEHTKGGCSKKHTIPFINRRDQAGTSLIHFPTTHRKSRGVALSLDMSLEWTAYSCSLALPAGHATLPQRDTICKLFCLTFKARCRCATEYPVSPEPSLLLFIEGIRRRSNRELSYNSDWMVLTMSVMSHVQISVRASAWRKRLQYFLFGI